MNNLRTQAFLVFIISVILHQIATWKYGLAIFPDSINYVHAAKTLLAEGDLFQFTGEYFISWPPLYSTILAIFVIPFSDVAIPNFSILHSLLLGLTAILVFNLLSSSTSLERKHSVWITIPLSLSFWPISLLSFEIVSEVLFILLSVSAFYFAFKKENWNLALVFISLAFLQRYIGFIWWIYIVLIGLFHSKSKIQWILKSTLSVIPMAFWLFRNWIISSTLTGVRSEQFISHWDNLIGGLDIITKWISPHFIPFSIRIAFLVVSLVFILGYLLTQQRKSIGYHATLFSFIYLVTIWLISTSGASEALSYRLLAPMYPFFLISLWSSVFIFTTTTFSFKPIYIYLFFGLISVYQTIFLIRIIQDRYLIGAGGYARDEWKKSNTLSWYSSHRLEHYFVGSNASDAIYAQSGDVIAMSPFDDQKDALQDYNDKSGIVIWFNKTNRKTLIPLDTLKQLWDLKAIAQFDDGSIWQKD